MAQGFETRWEKKAEDWAKKVEEKFSGKEQGECEKAEDVRPKWQKNYNPAGDLVGQGISYLIITYAPVYFASFFLTGWTAVYTVIFYSILVHVVVDVISIFLKARPFYYLGRVVANIAGVISMVVMVTIFPFSFPGSVGGIVQFALWVAIAIVAVVTLFEFVNIFGSDS